MVIEREDRHWPEAKVLSNMWTDVEDWDTHVISELALTQSSERHKHISLHYDVAKLLPQGYNNAQGLFKQRAEPEMLLKTGHTIQIESKRKVFAEDHFSDLVGDEM